ncbi:hypothetical protein [Streptomyces sp. R41]|uniref:Uncharacterized protein n=1 Tax=Streptomyces sp. R41 TaxID=3238632 RepID=A0AB39RSV1_9ACTN
MVHQILANAELSQWKKHRKVVARLVPLLPPKLRATYLVGATYEQQRFWTEIFRLSAAPRTAAARTLPRSRRVTPAEVAAFTSRAAAVGPTPLLATESRTSRPYGARPRAPARRSAPSSPNCAADT